MQAAMQVFAQEGYEKTRVEDIARAAGVGKGTVYEYFSSKEEIFEQAVVKGTEEYLASLERELAAQLSLEDKLLAVARQHLHFMVSQRDVARILASSPGLILPRLKQLMLDIRREIEDKVVRVIAAGIKGEHLRQVDTYLAARVFLGGLSAVAGPHCFQEESWELESTAQEICRIFLTGVVKRQSGSGAARFPSVSPC
jgi:AcrR family transcriptional regulator